MAWDEAWILGSGGLYQWLVGGELVQWFGVKLIS